MFAAIKWSVAIRGLALGAWPIFPPDPGTVFAGSVTPPAAIMTNSSEEPGSKEAEEGSTKTEEGSTKTGGGSTKTEKEENVFRFIRYGVTAAAGFAIFMNGLTKSRKKGTAEEPRWKGARTPVAGFGGIVVVPAFWFQAPNNAKYCAARWSLLAEDAERIKKRLEDPEYRKWAWKEEQKRYVRQGKFVRKKGRNHRFACEWNWLGLFFGASLGKVEQEVRLNTGNGNPDPTYDVDFSDLPCTRSSATARTGFCEGRYIMGGLAVLPNALFGFHIGITQKTLPRNDRPTFYLGVSGNLDILTKIFAK